MWSTIEQIIWGDEESNFWKNNKFFLKSDGNEIRGNPERLKVLFLNWRYFAWTVAGLTEIVFE